MNSYINLTKSFIKANGMSEAVDKGQKIKIFLLSIFSIFCIFLPVVVGVGFFVYVATETLMPIGLTSFGLELLLYIISVFSMIFGINIVFSEFYFSSDIEYILPLPLRAMQIVAAKFTSVFYMENIMQFMLILSCIIGFGLGSKMSIYGWIISVIGIVTIPILSLVYCAIISMLIMGLTRWIRNKELIQRLSIVLIFGLLVVLVASIGSLQTLDIGSAIESLAKGDKTVFKVFSVIFPNVLYFVKAISTSSIVDMFVYLLINIVGIVIMLGLAELLYFKGVIGLSSGVSTKKSKSVDKLLENNKVRGQTYAYFLKEIKVLLRTPAYFTNCIAINFIWPIFVYAVYKIGAKNISISDIKRLYSEGDSSIRLIVVLGIVGVAILITALNSISSNALSREGKHFQFLKYIPVDYKIQWNVKALVGAMWAFLGIVVFYIPASIYMRLGLGHILVHLILVGIAITFVAYMGIYIDSIQPKLIWDDELSSLRENYNTFFTMAISIFYVGVICIGGYFLFNHIDISIWAVYGILGIILILSCGIILMITKKSMVSNLENQEEA